MGKVKTGSKILGRFFKFGKKGGTKVDDAALLRKIPKSKKTSKVITSSSGEGGEYLTKSIKASRSKSVLAKTKVWNPKFMRNIKAGAMFGILGATGYGFYRAIGIIGIFSDAAENTINNFYGINCEETCEGDSDCISACQEKGSRNMILTGVAIAGGVGLLIALKFGGSKSNELVVTTK